ncbi:MAG TPA: hypothetical protein VGV34_04505, partial [Solirubrobacterales bacterium]|nr:hypothetical protein [Solirubrobacterales bacterium]
DGRRWRVRRRWLESPRPNLRRRWRKNKDEASGAWDLGWGIDAALGGFGMILLAVVAVVLLSVLLLGIALELIALALVLGASFFGRMVLRRPWIVEAVEVGEPEERVAFAVKGWRGSRAALRELRTAIAASGPPERLASGRPLATSRPDVARQGRRETE